MTAPTDLAAALLRDVKLYEPDWAKEPYDRSEMVESTVGDWLSRAEVLAALSRALDPALAERVGEEVESLRLWNRDDAADLLTALLTANAALRAEAFEWRDKAMEQMNRATKASQDAEAAEAQVEKLRQAVKGLAEVLDQHETKGPLPDTALMFCWLAAQNIRAVLRGYMLEKTE